MKIEKLLSSPSLPSPPSTALQLLQLSKAPDSEVEDYINVIRTDPALCGRLLKAANSPLFGARSEISTIERTVPMLGITSVTALTMGFSLSTDSCSSGPVQKEYEQYWRQSVIQAVIAERIDPSASRDERAIRFMTGLMLDIGKLAMLKAEPAEYVRVGEISCQQQRDVTDVENEVFGLTHAFVGAELLSRWNLPDSLCGIVGSHHHAPESDVQADQAAAILASSVGEYFCGTAKCGALQRLNEVAKQLYNMSESRVQTFLSEVRDRLETTCELFSVNAEEIPSPAELLAEANDQLVMISLQTQQAKSESEVRRRELELQNRELREETIRDPLTNAFNRRFFEESLAKEFSRAARSGDPLGLLFADIDYFKKLNDTYGHQFGDRVLAKVAECIEGASRESDIVARYGGEEFVVTLTNTDNESVGAVAERIRSAVASLRIRYDDVRVPVTISIGAACYHENDESPHALLRRADEMVYQCKKDGRNCVRLAELAALNSR